MRIFHVVEATLAGLGLHVIDLVRSQLAAGHEVHLMYADERMDVDFRESLAKLSGLKTQHMECSRVPSPRALNTIRQCRNYIIEHGRFDIIHGHSSMGGAVARIASKRGDGLRVYTPNAVKTLDPTVSIIAKFVYWTIEWYLAWFRTDLLITVSQQEAQHLVRLGFPRSKIRTIHNGTDIDPRVSEAQMRAEFGLDEGDICALFVGRFEEQKAPLKLIAAIKLLMAAGAPENLKILMVGDGPLHQEVAEEINSAGLDDVVFLVGRHRGVDAMQAAEFFVLPSNYEGFPYVLIEAIQCGLPIVTTQIGGATDLVSDGQTGFVRPIDDAAGLARAIRELAEDPDLRRRFGAQASANSATFTAAAMSAATEVAYSEFLAHE